MVGAVTEPDLAGGERSCRAAGGPAGVQPPVPGVQRRSEHLVEGVAAGAHFRRVGLSDDNAAASF